MTENTCNNLDGLEVTKQISCLIEMKVGLVPRRRTSLEIMPGT